jgi:hypothetical protein
MDKRASFVTVRDPVKAIQVKLPHKRREMCLVKVVRSNIFHKGVGIMNLEGVSIWREGYDVAIPRLSISQRRNNTETPLSFCYVR